MILVVHCHDPTAKKPRAEVTSPGWVVTKLKALVNTTVAASHKFRDQKNSKESDKVAKTNIGRNLSKQNS
jgi:hypothetical protein